MIMYLFAVKHDGALNYDYSSQNEFQEISLKRNTFFKISSLFGKGYVGENSKISISQSILTRRQTVVFTVDRIVEFSWMIGSRRVSYKTLESVENKAFKYWLAHALLPVYFSIEQIYLMFHMSSVEIGGRACLFSAPSFGGKSTMVHHFLQKGHALVADDQLPVLRQHGRYCAVPSYPYCRNYRKVHDLGNKVDNFMSHASPIGAIYQMTLVPPEDTITVREVCGAEKFKIIKSGCQFKQLIGHDVLFDQLSEMTATIPIFSITVPENMQRMDEVYAKIMNHFQQVTSALGQLPVADDFADYSGTGKTEVCL